MSGEEFAARLADIIGCEWTLTRVWFNSYELRFRGKEDGWNKGYVLQFGEREGYRRSIFPNLEHTCKDNHTVLQSLADQIVEGRLFSSLSILDISSFSSLSILDCSTGVSQFLAACKQPLEAILIEAELNFTRLREQDNGQQQTSRAS